MGAFEFVYNDENSKLWRLIEVYTDPREGLRDIYVSGIPHVIESFWVEILDKREGNIVFRYMESGNTAPEEVMLKIEKVEDDGNILTITGNESTIQVILKDVGDDE